MKKLLFETIGPAIIDIIGAFLPIKRFYEWRTYTIKKGKHKGFRWWTRSAHLVKFVVDMKYADYDFLAMGNDKFDWNKTYGITTSNIYKFSFRIVDRRLHDKWEWGAYWYINGVRGHKHLGSTKIGDLPIFEIRVGNLICEFKMFDVEDGHLLIEMPEGTKLGNLYKSYPYHGGNQTANKTRKIRIKEIE